MNIFFIISKHKWNLMGYFLIGMVTAILPIADLYITNSLIDSVINKREYLLYLWLIIAFSAMSVILFYIKFKYHKFLSIKLIKFIREKKTNHLTTSQYSPSFDGGVTKSELLINAPEIIDGAVIGILNILNTFVILIASISLLFLFHWILAVIAIIISATAVLITILFSGIGAKYFVQMNTISNQYNSNAKNIIQWRNKMHLLQKISFFNLLLLDLTISKNSKIYENYKKAVYYHIPAVILGFIIQILGTIIPAILAKEGLVSISVIAISGFVFGTVFSSMLLLPNQISGYVNSKKLLEKYLTNSKQNNEITDNVFEITLTNFNPTIETKKLFKKELNMSINQSSKIHITGRNGVGKSTMFKSLITNANYAGKILINKNNEFPLIDCPNIVFINEHPHIFDASLRENIALFSTKYKDKELEKVMKMVNLKMNLDKKISLSEISDGQKQKISLARVFLIKPNFIFIDEGFNNISVTDRKKIHELLLSLNVGVVLISHKEVANGYKKIEII